VTKHRMGMVRLELSSCTANTLIFIPVRLELSSGYGQNSRFLELMNHTVRLELSSGTARTLICIPDIPQTSPCLSITTTDTFYIRRCTMLKPTRRSQYSQECKTPRRHCFLYLVTLPFHPCFKNKSISRTHNEHFCVKFGDPSCIRF